MHRFRTRYGKPKTLTDRYDECQPETVARLLAKPTAEFDWSDFNNLFRVGVAPATYEEGLYFVPDALNFLRRNPADEGVHCVADVLWFLSEHAHRLVRDGLLTEVHGQVRSLLMAHTAKFVIVHWDRAMNQKMGFAREHYDYVEGGQLVVSALEALCRFRTLEVWAAEFLAGLGEAPNHPVRSAWLLECLANARRWVLFRPSAAVPDAAAMPELEGMCARFPMLRGIWNRLQSGGFVRELPNVLQPERLELKRLAAVIRSAGELFSAHPTYWRRVFDQLEIAADQTGLEASST
ncbi:MAG: hypothetical protein IT581_11135 [Verrucomicrobiales bacterium]|nr:hypothetical protein [Verrucomicrobiales bacterium]